MPISKDNIRGELVRQTTETKGWGVILEEVTFVMNDARDRLLRLDPSDSIEIAKYQERHKALERLMIKIEQITKEV